MVLFWHKRGLAAIRVADAHILVGHLTKPLMLEFEFLGKGLTVVSLSYPPLPHARG